AKDQLPRGKRVYTTVCRVQRSIAMMLRMLCLLLMSQATLCILDQRKTQGRLYEEIDGVAIDVVLKNRSTTSSTGSR
ncbi:hypothetical protein PMAYCL1PPCAC_16280, partial [Pristionchus mayeri]